MNWRKNKVTLFFVYQFIVTGIVLVHNYEELSSDSKNFWPAKIFEETIYFCFQLVLVRFSFFFLTIDVLEYCRWWRKNRKVILPQFCCVVMFFFEIKINKRRYIKRNHLQKHRFFFFWSDFSSNFCSFVGKLHSTCNSRENVWHLLEFTICELRKKKKAHKIFVVRPSGV